MTDVTNRATRRPRRVLAVLECRPTDDVVRARAVEVARDCGGYLTLVAIAPRPFPWLNTGPYCIPRVTQAELREAAVSALAQAVALVPSDIALITAVDEGRTQDVIRRRVETAAHDLVVVRRHRSRSALSMPVPVMAC
jgi:hypothetical protein